MSQNVTFRQALNTSLPNDDIITMIRGILRLCIKLRTLAVINIDQNDWSRIEAVIPATTENLIVGPIHGPLDIHILSRAPLLRNLTSVNTYMGDHEIHDIVMCPRVRKFRRVFSALHLPYEYAMQQLPAVSKSETLAEMEILIVGTENEREMYEKQRCRYSDFFHDTRTVCNFQLDSGSGWTGWLYDEFVKEPYSEHDILFPVHHWLMLLLPANQ